MGLVVDISGVEGFKDFERDLKRLDGKLQRKLVRQSMRYAARPLVRELVRNVPVLTGALQNSIRLKAGRRRRHFMSIQSLASVTDGDHWYGGPINFGWTTGPKNKGRGGKDRLGRGPYKRTKVPGEHFFEHSFEDVESEVRQRMSQRLGHLLQKELSKK